MFNHMVDQILPHLEKDRVEPLIVVLQLIKATRWNGKSSVQSHFNVSQLYVDLGLKEIVGFRNNLVILMLLRGATSSSVRISQVSSHGPGSGVEELTQGSVQKKVNTRVGNRYECGKCSHTHRCVALRFKVEVMVFDGTRSIRLLLWDKETMMLYGKRAE
ncbi:hypothetical protein AHAS_Ahas02G0158100 [Arachis hypogaea]